MEARLSPINVKHDSQPQSLHFMTKGMDTSAMMRSTDVHIIGIAFER